MYGTLLGPGSRRNTLLGAASGGILGGYFAAIRVLGGYLLHSLSPSSEGRGGWDNRHIYIAVACVDWLIDWQFEF